ncbi:MULTISPECIES: relaxase/mobilization nuclease domain-containing protein [unclassified Pseudomonas]|uniref:relaxase/mobilization nuclease domain-containing protein n=1 Tax=unclassified Pseudomonas TaxID=196821 RepID=UPI00249F0B23|nr:relaxase/mobilization nuclease domain-containing protein [Pseudomonas sp. UYIF39]MDI3358132.1 relaxase/mobilization nuclease domain-containing protein [Pseudomonas sp. UYIF39]
MISKGKEFSPTFRNRIVYEFAARAQDFDKRKHVEFIGGNLISKNPYYEIMDEGERKVFVDVEPFIHEFESYTRLYKGESKKLCGHYILSLSKGEALTTAEWTEAVRKYMSDLGYDETTKYVAVIHRDTDCEHAHIVSSRVRLVEADPLSSRSALGAHFELVSDSNDRFKGMDAVREIEQLYNLAVPVSDGWTKEPCVGDPEMDQAHIIRGISKAIFKANNRPVNMSQLVDRFAERGIQIRVRDENGVVEGVSYRLDRQDGRWISGSTIMATKLTFQSLQRNGVAYLSSRDNAKLGIGMPTASPDAQSVRNDGVLFRAYVKISKPNERLKTYLSKHSKCTNIHCFNDRTQLFLGFNFGISFTTRKKTRSEVELEIERERVAKLLTEMFNLIQDIMDTLFRGMAVHFDQDAIVADYPQTALRLSTPVVVDSTGQFVLDENWEESVLVQTKKQLSSLAKMCYESEKEAILGLDL